MEDDTPSQWMEDATPSLPSEWIEDATLSAIWIDATDLKKMAHDDVTS